MATLKDVRFEDFVAWIGAIEKMDGGIKKDLSEAMSAVPLVERLMMMHVNAMEKKAAKRDLQRSSDIINTLVAIHFILKGRTRPGSPGPKPIAWRTVKARPGSKG